MKFFARTEKSIFIPLLGILLCLFSLNTLESKIFLERHQRYYILEPVYGSEKDRELFSDLVKMVESRLFDQCFVKLPVEVQDYRYARTLFKREFYSRIHPLESHVIEVGRYDKKILDRLIHQYEKHPEFRICTFGPFDPEGYISKISRHAEKDSVFKIRMYVGLMDKRLDVQIYKLKRYPPRPVTDMLKREHDWISVYESGTIDLSRKKFVEIDGMYSENLDVKLQKAIKSKHNILDTWSMLSTIFFEGGLEQETESELEFEKYSNSLVMEIKKYIIRASMR